MSAEQTYILTKDGKEVFRGTNNEIFAWVLKHQPQSFDYAMKWGGYKITKAVTN
jgi:hypothetical protein